jgi:transcriptional regulator with XRE-family HTH domain
MPINIGARLRADLERRCGLARCRISWLENGRAIPTIETLARIADALEIPAYRLLQDVEDGSEGVVAHKIGADVRRVPCRKSGMRLFSELRTYLGRMSDEDKLLLVFIAKRMAGRFSMGSDVVCREAGRNETKRQVRN